MSSIPSVIPSPSANNPTTAITAIPSPSANNPTTGITAIPFPSAHNPATAITTIPSPSANNPTTGTTAISSPNAHNSATAITAIPSPSANNPTTGTTTIPSRSANNPTTAITAIPSSSANNPATAIMTIPSPSAINPATTIMTIPSPSANNPATTISITAIPSPSANNLATVITAIPSPSANNPATAITTIPSLSANNHPAAAITVIPSPSADDPKINALYTNMTDTPLHSAAAAGETLLAMEIATLEPFFARTLNGDGRSPMHLALLNGHIETVRSLLTIDPELVRVKGKYRMTCLHHAAAKDETTEILAEFLMYCPSAIEDLTSRCESALHIAVKHGSLGACRVIFGWLKKERRSDLDRVLNWKDADGNNVAHIAVSTNERGVLKQFVLYGTSVRTKNLQGKSCLDLAADQHDEEVMKILIGGSLCRRLNQIKDVKELSHAEYLSNCAKTMIFTEGYAALIDKFYGKAVPMEIRSVYLVVTGVIIAVTYQAMLGISGSNAITTTTAAAPAPSPMDNSADLLVTDLSYLLAFYTFCFTISSLFVVVLLLPLPGSMVVIIPSVALIIGYLIQMLVECYDPMNDKHDARQMLQVPALTLLVMICSLVLIMVCYLVIQLRGPSHVRTRGYIRRMMFHG